MEAVAHTPTRTSGTCWGISPDTVSPLRHGGRRERDREKVEVRGRRDDFAALARHHALAIAETDTHRQYTYTTRIWRQRGREGGTTRRKRRYVGEEASGRRPHLRWCRCDTRMRIL